MTSEPSSIQTITRTKILFRCESPGISQGRKTKWYLAGRKNVLHFRSSSLKHMLFVTGAHKSHQRNGPIFAQVQGRAEEHGTPGALLQHRGSCQGRSGGYTAFKQHLGFPLWLRASETPPVQMRLLWVSLAPGNPSLAVFAHTLSWLGSEGDWCRGFGQEYPVAAPYNNGG